MPKKNKLYQCPYELQCKCDLTLPCLGCETWAEHYGEFNSGVQQRKAKTPKAAHRPLRKRCVQ